MPRSTKTSARTKTPAAKTKRRAPAPKAKAARAVAAARDTASASKTRFPVVALGASAGGLEAFTELFRALPADTGMAFVVLQHLDPSHESSLPELLASTTPMPVRTIRDRMRLAPDQVHVLPPNRRVRLSGGLLRLSPRTATHDDAMVIDGFLASLAESCGPRAIGVVLSGTGTDGSEGLGAIKDEGGVTICQDPATARYDGMPRAAIARGVVDSVLGPEAIARELHRLAHHPLVTAGAVDGALSLGESDEALRPLYSALRASTGVDFRIYKQSTIRRRIARRMLLLKLDSLEAYVRHTRGNSAELATLFEDLLINVTSFFRDPEVFAALKKSVFPKLARGRPADSPIRIWVPGCATGEEAYSLAMALLETLGHESKNVPIQIFASDVSESSIARARAGVYPDSLRGRISPERLRRFFTKVEDGYQISQSIRDVCIFARHDLTRDPPFSRLDLISCRNLLIYLDADAQQRIFPVFHYALKPQGFLVLGASETIGAHADLFGVVDRAHRIYSKKSIVLRSSLEFTTPDPHAAAGGAHRRTVARAHDAFDPRKEADRILLARSAPPSLLLDPKLEVLQFRGQTGPYVAPVSGAASLEVMRLVREGLAPELRSALRKADKTGRPARRSGIPVDTENGIVGVTLEVIPLRPPGKGAEHHFLVIFEDEGAASRKGEAPSGAPRPRVSAADGKRLVVQLRRELAVTKEYLQSSIEEKEAANEELRSALEELQSSNEELQSTNEELETAKEELQSTNEELTTVNDELHARNLDLAQLNNDLLNVLGSVQTPIVIVGKDLRIRRFTPPAAKVLDLGPDDVGRPLRELEVCLPSVQLTKLIEEVTSHLGTREVEARHRSGRWYLVQVRPYRSYDDRIEGAVLAMLDITEHRAAKTALEEAERRLEVALRDRPAD